MKLERQPRAELEPKLIDAYAQTFIPRRDLYPVQLPHGHYVSVRKHLSDEIVSAHLRAVITIGAYALNPANEAKWICYDADDDQQWNDLHRLATALADRNVPGYLEPSRRGGHLWLFLSPLVPLSGTDARRFAQTLLTRHGLPAMEIFPKQDQLTGGPGSLVRLPLGVHQKTHKRYHFVNLAGDPLAPTIRDQVRLLGNPGYIPPDFITAVLQSTSEPETVSPTPAFSVQADQDAPLSERIKGHISVYDFVSQYVELDGRGRGHCPFHDDQHKSFSVNLRDNYWHCFAGCGGGSLIDFWMRWREKHRQDGSFIASIKSLADMLL